VAKRDETRSISGTNDGTGLSERRKSMNTQQEVNQNAVQDTARRLG